MGAESVLFTTSDFVLVYVPITIFEAGNAVILVNGDWFIPRVDLLVVYSVVIVSVASVNKVVIWYVLLLKLKCFHIKKNNSFAANFLTDTCSQCHIYLNSKGHHVI